MTNVFKSEFGEVKTAKFLHHTPKGYGVEEDWGHGRKYKTTWLIKHHKGLYQTFISQLDAKNHAVEWILAEKEKCLKELRELDAKMASLPVT